jgi:hypothetical protein
MTPPSKGRKVRPHSQGRRGVFKSVSDLATAIEESIRENNANPKPFVWTKKVDAILEKIARCKAITVTLH